MKKYVQSSIKGINHVKNEDDILIIQKPDYQMFFVFDGVGSSENSDIGIDLARDFIINQHQNYLKNKDVNFKELMYDANKTIVTSGVIDAHTTYCSIFYHCDGNGAISYSNLGDSRIYCVNKNNIEQISIDDKDSPDTHVINKCLGDENLKHDDFRQNSKLINGSKILLSTDGFHELMEPALDTFLSSMDGIYLKPVKKKLETIVAGKNLDDSTFVIIK